MNTPPVVSAQEWSAAREALLVEDKTLTRAKNALAAKRRRLPWLAVEQGCSPPPRRNPRSSG